MAAGIADDRLWRLDPVADEWGVLRGRLWMRTFASVVAIRQAELVAEQIRGVREAITAQLGH